jgi:hypothetical protein
MTSSLANHLDELYANKDIQGYLSLSFKGEKLKAGWIEKGILSKCIDGELIDKENQNKYVIPLSTSLKAVIDRGINYPGDAGILILGPSGLTCEKFVIVFRNESKEDEISRMVSAFWIKGYNPNEITRLFLKYELGSDLLSTFEEPGIDYIEFLREQTSTGLCTETFSLRIPSNWMKSRTWIQDLVKDDTSDSVLFKHDVSNNTTALALLFSIWMKDMIESLKIDKPIGACFFLRGNHTEAFFWDGPREILTSSSFGKPDVECLAMNILLPLWAESSEPIPSRESEGPSESDSSHSTGEAIPPTPSLPPEFEAIQSRVRGLLNRIDVEDTYRRVERLEAIVGELEYQQEQVQKQKKEEPAPQYSNLMESRIKDALDSLEELTKRLAELEERFISVCKNLE